MTVPVCERCGHWVPSSLRLEACSACGGALVTSGPAYDAHRARNRAAREAKEAETAREIEATLALKRLDLLHGMKTRTPDEQAELDGLADRLADERGVTRDEILADRGRVIAERTAEARSWDRFLGCLLALLGLGWALLFEIGAAAALVVVDPDDGRGSGATLITVVIVLSTALVGFGTSWLVFHAVRRLRPGTKDGCAAEILGFALGIPAAWAWAWLLASILAARAVA